VVTARDQVPTRPPTDSTKRNPSASEHPSAMGLHLATALDPVHTALEGPTMVLHTPCIGVTDRVEASTLQDPGPTLGCTRSSVTKQPLPSELLLLLLLLLLSLLLSLSLLLLLLLSPSSLRLAGSVTNLRASSRSPR